MPTVMLTYCQDVSKLYHWLIYMTQVITKPSHHHKSKSEIEEELNWIRRAQKNPEHLAPLYNKYHDEIFLYIEKRTNNLDLTADLTSRTFLQCIRHIKQFKYQGVPFSSWLYRIALNEVKQHFRKSENTKRAVSIEEHQIESIIDEIDYTEIPIDPHVLISVLLEQLDENEIQFIELRFFEGHSFREIGYLLGLTEVNAKIKTYRILDKLKKLSKNIKYNE